jgi:serine/threonine-protein kinase
MMMAIDIMTGRRSGYAVKQDSGRIGRFWFNILPPTPSEATHLTVQAMQERQRHFDQSYQTFQEELLSSEGIYCTRLECKQPENAVTPAQLTALLAPALPADASKLHCACCGMPLLLRGDRYLPLQYLGGGGFGRTFLALDLDYGRKGLGYHCVIKQLRPQPGSTAKPYTEERRAYIKNLFLEEAKALQSLSHECIPQLRDYFESLPPPDRQWVNPLPSQDAFFYLVQNYIAGENLETRVSQARFTETETVHFLTHILTILQYVHDKGKVHHDIKPANLICQRQPLKPQAGKPSGQPSEQPTEDWYYLIDFGAVRQVVQSAGQATAIGTSEYMPPEQMAGLSASQVNFYGFDLFALAGTCIYALTGEGPHSQGIPGDLQSWKSRTRVSLGLAQILNRMLAIAPAKRYQSARQVLQALHRWQWQQQWGSKIGGLGIAVVAVAALAFWLVPRAERMGDRISLGEEYLLPVEFPTAERDQGSKAYREGKYTDARQAFEQSRSQYKNDPETLIYLNNAKAAEQGNPLRIAVNVPIRNDDRDDDDNAYAKEVLRGVAQAQEEANLQGGIQGRKLQIQIVDDNDKALEPQAAVEEALVTAKRLMAIPEILGVIGHDSSNTTLAAGKIYGEVQAGDRRLVLISPTSTAVRSAPDTVPTAGDYRLPFNPYVFRVASSDTVAAGDLVDFVLTRPERKQIFVITEKDNQFSTSISQEFSRILQEKSSSLPGRTAEQQVINIQNPCSVQLSNKGAIPGCIEAAKKAEADTVLLAVGNELAGDVVRSIFNKLDGLFVLGADPVYSNILINSVGQAAVEKLAIAVPWHRSDRYERTGKPQSLFEIQSQNLWESPVNWRTAMSYDAAQALIAGLKRAGNSPTRQSLYTALKDPGFTAPGSVGEVRFDALGDRQPIPSLGVIVTLENLGTTSARYHFITLEQPAILP